MMDILCCLLTYSSVTEYASVAPGFVGLQGDILPSGGDGGRLNSHSRRDLRRSVSLEPPPTS